MSSFESNMIGKICACVCLCDGIRLLSIEAFPFCVVIFDGMREC